jgi:hypothetical protein
MWLYYYTNYNYYVNSPYGETLFFRSKKQRDRQLSLLKEEAVNKGLSSLSYSEGRVKVREEYHYTRGCRYETCKGNVVFDTDERGEVGYIE